MSYILSLIVIVCSIAANTCLETCVGTNENSRFTSLKSQLKTFEQNINALESGLKRKTLNSNPGCPNNWSRFRDHCYFFSKDKKNWFEAERICRSHGSSLASIADKTENNWVFVKSQEKQHSFADYWIGLTDVEHEKWIYSEDFSPVTNSLWSKGEPSGGKGENCLQVPNGRVGLWNDYPCKYAMNYVCRKHAIKNCATKQN